MSNRDHVLRLITFAAFPATLGASGAGCATPAPLVRLHPAAENVIRASGREVATQESHNIQVAAAFERQDPDYLGIRVEVENDSRDWLDVDPEDVSFATCAKLARESCGTPHRVVDPERMLARLDGQRAIEQADAANDQAAGAALLFLTAVSDVASAGSRHRSHDSQSVWQETDDEDARHASALSSVAAEKEEWLNVALRRTTVAPGRGVAGLVFIPIDPGAHFVALRIEVGDEVFVFHFRQVTREARS